ncbi:MAG TPA: VCBS domain-containing protein, partial [Novosphingobium sp.]|nr:VCBS domain-containing protein [Novosphingobium sp.]
PVDGTDADNGANTVNTVESFTYQVTDANGNTATSTLTIDVIDDVPAASNDGNSLTEDTVSVGGNILSNDVFGADGPHAQQISAVSGAGAGTVGGNTAGAYGTLHLNIDGSYTYQLNTAAIQGLDAGEHVTDTFSYTIRDGDGDTSTATLAITVNGANDASVANDDTNWVLDVTSGANPTTTGNVLQSISHPNAPSGSFADVADTDVDTGDTLSVTGVTGGSVGNSVPGSHGSIVINANGTYTYTLNASDGAVNALGAGETLTDSFSYTASDGTTTDTATVTITIFGTNDAPVVTGSAVAVSEEGLSGGNADSSPAGSDTTNNATASGSITISDVDTTDDHTVKLGTPSQTVRATDGTLLTWSVSADGHTLKGYSTNVNNPEILVTIDNDGHYTVTLGGPIQHTNTVLEDLTSFVIPVLVNDGTTTVTQTNGITVTVEDDSPVLGSFSPAANTVNNVANDTATGTFAYSAGGDGHGSFSFTAPTITGVTYSTSQAAVDLDGDGHFTAGATLTATAGSDTLFTLAVDADGHYKFTLVTPDAATTETLSFASLSAGGPGFRELTDDANTVGINELGRVEFTSNGTGVNAQNNAFGVSNPYVDPGEFFTMEFHNPGASGDNQPGTNAEFLESIDLKVNDLKNSPSNVGPNVTVQWTATNTSTGQSQSGFATITSTGAVHIDPSITFNQIKIENFDDPSLNNDGARFSISGVTIYKLILPTDQNLNFGITATDHDGDVSSTSSLSILVDATPPVALDLDGDGLEFLGRSAGVTYDYGHGVVQTAWTASDDGLLAHSTSHGLDLVFTDDAAGAKTDLQGLQIAYDSNGDGQLTEADANFSEFGVWRDANSNGLVDAGEFKSLAEMGITSIALTTNGPGSVEAGGDVVVNGTAQYTMNGTSFTLADVVFATTKADDRIAARTTEISAVSLAAAGFLASEAVHAQPLPPAAAEIVAAALQTFHASVPEIRAALAEAVHGAPAITPLQDHAPQHQQGETSSHTLSHGFDQGTTHGLSEIAGHHEEVRADEHGASEGARVHAAGPTAIPFDGAGGSLMQALLLAAQTKQGVSGGEEKVTGLSAVKEAVTQSVEQHSVDTLINHFAAHDGSHPVTGSEAGAAGADHVLGTLLAGGIEGLHVANIAGGFEMAAMAAAEAHSVAAA